ncbi:galactonate dehydratase [Halopelagius fulvigenes]|uniref:Galactonate dehydratase n=1 Tax=Halopelagius fulvigenes TaxID=1198324 RepID=A0ABD5U1C1_9EURY
MRVVNYELFNVPPRWTFLKVETSDGSIGWGEISLSRQRRAASGAVADFMEEYVIGNDPTRIEDHWQAMYRSGRFRGGPVLMTGIAGIDQALWDIKGKIHGMPISEFLGGPVRDRIRLYQHVRTKAEVASANDDSDDRDGENQVSSPEAFVEDARRQINAGFDALKLVPFGMLDAVAKPGDVDRARTVVRAVREEVGPDVDLALDFHGRASKASAKQMATALEEFDPMFYEEAVTGPEHANNYRELARHTSVPIATGERRHSRWAFKEVFEDGAVDIVQPDLCYAGGISELHRIGTMAEAYDVALAPHCPFGPIALAACLQVDAAMHNAFIQEQIVHREDYLDYSLLSYLENPEVLAQEDGHVDVLTEPGLGITVDEEIVQRHAIDNPQWESPGWRHLDGRVAQN